MKLRLSKLRTLIEAALNANSIDSMCLYVDKASSDRISIHVYDGWKFAELLEQNVMDSGHFAQAIVGTISISDAKSAIGQPCNGAWMVDSVAGNGKLMYGLGYIYAGGRLMPDRKTVKPPARAAWKNQFSKRGAKAAYGKTIFPFDDYENPQTPDPNDDCEVYGKSDPDSLYLDNAYSGIDDFSSAMHTMLANHDELCARYGKKKVESEVEYAAGIYFSNRYNET